MTDVVDLATTFGCGSDEPLLPSEKSIVGTDSVKKLSLLFGALIGVLVHLSTLGVNVWLNAAGPLREGGGLFWSIVSSILVATLVVLVYLVLSALTDELQPFALTTLALETRFVAGFMCSIVFSSSCYDLVLLRANGNAPLLLLTISSLTLLFFGWLSVFTYEKVRMEEIEEEEKDGGK